MGSRFPKMLTRKKGFKKKLVVTHSTAPVTQPSFPPTAWQQLRQVFRDNPLGSLLSLLGIGRGAVDLCQAVIELVKHS